MGRRVVQVIALLASAIAVVAIFAVAPTFLHDRLVFGTFATSGAPPLVDFCGRHYYPAQQAVSGLPRGLAVIDTAPSGMPVLADLLSPAEQAQHHTNVCTMQLFVQTGPHSYLSYGLSGGP